MSTDKDTSPPRTIEVKCSAPLTVSEFSRLCDAMMDFLGSDVLIDAKASKGREGVYVFREAG